MQIREILNSKKTTEIKSNKKEVLGKKQFNGNFVVSKIKREKKEEKEIA